MYTKKLKFFLNIKNFFRRLFYNIWKFMNNVKFDLKEHGDLIERGKLEFIETTIYNYQYLWSNFIGHNQNGFICSSNLKSNEEEKRKLIGSLNYSILGNLVNLEKYKTKIINFSLDDSSVDSSIELKEIISNYIITFGIIRDRQEKMLNQVFSSSSSKTYSPS